MLAPHRFGLRDFCVSNTANETSPAVRFVKKGENTEEEFLFGNLGAVVFIKGSHSFGNH